MPKLPKGHTSVLSRAFKYTPAAQTNVAKTFARIKREAEAQRRREQEEQHVVTFKRKESK